MTMKILIITASLDMGGTENMLLSSLPFYRNNDVEIEILCNTGGELDTDFINEGVKIHDFIYKGNSINEAYSLYKILDKNKYDLIHSHTNHTSGFLALVSKIKGIPFCISVHNQKSEFRLNWVKNKMLNIFRKSYLFIQKKMSINYSDLIIGHSKVNLIYFKENWFDFPQKFRAIKNGIDFFKLEENLDLNKDKNLKLINFSNDSKITFVHIGSFRKQKNHLFLINCFKELKPIQNNYKLILLGSGSKLIMDKVKQKVFELGLDSHTLFVGMEPNIRPYLERSDIFIFPSLYEGFGNVLIEAQYLGLPIVASNILPHHESVYENYHPFLFSPTDINDCVEKITNLIELVKNGKIDNTVNKAYSFAKKFTIEQMVMNFLCEYKKILKQN
jgi:glycosyltransferase EpsF